MKLINKQSLYGLTKAKKLFNLKEYEDNIIEMNKKNARQEELNNKYVQLMQNERDRLLKKRKEQIMEDISDHIRDWFREFYEKIGDFHPYPEANKSGTILLLTDETMSLEEFKEYLKNQELSEEEKKSMEEKLKARKEKQREKNRKEKLKELKNRKKLQRLGHYDIGDELKNNKNVEKLEKTFAQFSTDWRNVDEYLNKQQDAIEEWVTENELAVIHKELRMLVDKYMRTEYKMLKQAWCADNKTKYKPLREKTKHTANKKGGKKMEYSTDDPRIKSMYYELKAEGIICNYVAKGFEDYYADFNILADDLRNDDNLTTLKPSKADIKLAIQDILFGMGTFDVEKPKSLCLVGPANNGKKLLCNIIATEIGALFINLSPEKTFRFQENLKYFIRIVTKVAKAFQPTIIFIEEAHRVFWKKIPKDQIDIQPTLLKNALIKNILSTIKKNDKIMLIGTSSMPWSADNMFKKAFPNILMIPESDYGTIFLMWLELLTQKVNKIHFEDSIFSVLAMMFQKYNTGDITDNVSNTLSFERRLQLHSKPLDPNEFLDYFLTRSRPLLPPQEQVSEKYIQWNNKTNKYAKLRILKEAEKAKKAKKK